MELIEKFERLMELQNSYDCPFDVETMGYKCDKHYITPEWPLGTHTYFAIIQIAGKREFVYSDTFLGLLQDMINFILNKTGDTLKVMEEWNTRIDT